MTRQASSTGHGIQLTVELERDELLPGRLVGGRVHLTASRTLEARGILATLIATETWQYETTETDSQGHTQTRTVTRREELRRLPVQLMGPGAIGPGAIERPFELPVPPLGPATLDARVARLDWTVEVKVDVPRSGDVSVQLPVRVLQPTALLRAGVIHVGQFALYEAADAQARGARASVKLEPMPLCLGAPFEGRIQLELEQAMDLQEVRLELRVAVKATVASGLSEVLTVWVGQLVGPGTLAAGPHDLPGQAVLPARDLATIELPHGRTNAELHLILARRMARDPHLVRDVTLCTTTEL